jgi:hypothetical protein
VATPAVFKAAHVMTAKLRHPQYSIPGVRS